MTYTHCRPYAMAFALAFLLAMVAFTTPTLASAEISGALEVGPRYSAIHTMSEATGDPVAYVVRNDSVPGRRILSACLEPLYCQVQVPRFKESENGSDMGFKEGASGWFEILEASSPRIDPGVQLLKRVDTRFGALAISSATAQGIQWRGKSVVPELSGDMAFVGSYEIGDKTTGSDVLLVQTQAVGSCPVMLNFLVVSPRGVTASERFGTCTSLYRAVQGYNSPVITVHMVGYQGKLDPANPMRNSIRNRETYVFQNGKLTHLAAK